MKGLRQQWLPRGPHGSLRSQIATLNGKRGEHLKYMPYAFTENGIAMLSSVLRFSKAIEVNIRIMRAFVSMRRFLLSNAQVFQRIEKFNAQYPPLTIRYTESFHDRFLILDDKELYLISASLKDLGKKCFAFTKLDPSEIAGLKARMGNIR